MPTHAIVIQGMLGVFQKLVASKSQDHEGFKILKAIFEFVPEADLSQYTAQVGPVRCHSCLGHFSRVQI